MAKLIAECRVVKIRHLNNEYFIITLTSGRVITDVRAGQFVQVRVDGSRDTFLRRPVSVYDIDPEKNQIRLLIRIAGEGTRTLSELSEGETLNIITPLGNSFTLPPEGSRSLLVGGGVGVAPLYLLGRELKDAKRDFSFLLGYRSSDQIIEEESFAALAPLHLTTDDGSYGTRGMVTSHPVILSGDYTHIFTCGPDPMMRSVASLAYASGKECEVSLENLMACGIGICLCCVEPTTEGNLNSCTEGPVFNIKRLKWQI
jgi:dihydroorotate dehydrogenase electron transfer subunit